VYSDDPATGRFLNADSHINANGDISGFNMYAYCSNNPVMCVDLSGSSLINGSLNEYVGGSTKRNGGGV